MGGKEKNQSVIRIEIINAKLAYDVILSFYNHPITKIKPTSTKYLLEMFKCIPIYLLAKNWAEVFFVWIMMLNYCMI
jgi:hypothetical protein